MTRRSGRLLFGAENWRGWENGAGMFPCPSRLVAGSNP